MVAAGAGLEGQCGDARGAARDAARGAARDAAWGAAWDVIYALIAWDDCADLLDLPEGALRVMSAAGHPPATLMLPAVVALATPPVTAAVVALSDTSNR